MISGHEQKHKLLNGIYGNASMFTLLFFMYPENFCDAMNGLEPRQTA
jgi:hypothetical protein